MKYEQLKEEVRSIAEIAQSVPEVFRERCFELLLKNLLSSAAPAEVRTEISEEAQTTETDGKKPPAVSKTNGAIPTPAQVKVFMQKTATTTEDLAKILIYEDEKVLFIHEPSGNKIAKGQIQWALLLALKNGIERNVFDVDPEAVRSICQDKGFYDGANFANNFKTAAAKKLFQGEMEKQGAPQKLTVDGFSELAVLVKALGSQATK
ncbi:MAG TPA: hypothetical protein VK819_01320 [Acidobacteriaceae bacterium]|jgi:hypothetical protein|nr:hypothetical protein [Acidobacteriaceae bacterium]